MSTPPVASVSPPPVPRLEIEPTPIGDQSLVPGVVPIMAIDRLSLRAAAPLRSNRHQKPADHGLFDLAARDQLDLFAPSGAPK